MKVEIEDLESAYAWAEETRKKTEQREEHLGRTAHPTDLLTMNRDTMNAAYVSKLIETIIDDVNLSGESIIECERP